MLKNHYRDVWGDCACESQALGAGALGGHAFGDRQALHMHGGLLTAVDGSPQAYEAARRQPEEADEPLFPIRGEFLELQPGFTGNAAVLDPDSQDLHLAVEWSGTFPLYFTRWRNGLLFANRLRPLVDITSAPVDRLGLIQFLRQGFILGNRTPFRGIQRLRPGEALRFNVTEGHLATQDRSRLWVGPPVTHDSDLPLHCVRHLIRSVRASMEATSRPALMMSGGWDSRTLMAGYNTYSQEHEAVPVSGYSHGDVQSRELNLVRRLCSEVEVPLHLEPIDERVFDLYALRRDFERTGTVNFPHWHRSGHVLRELGVDCAVAGIFGEVLGGHYGRTMTASGWRKILALLREWSPSGAATSQSDPVSVALRVLRLDQRRALTHWYLDEEFDRSIRGKQDRINADIESALFRLRDRGINRPARLVEACITEHRGSQYIAGQTISSRAAVDVAHPYAGRDFLHLATRIPAKDKVHNKVNRAMLESLNSALLGHPMAATLVPAGAPLALQEASRAVRKLWEATSWKCYFLTDRRTPVPRLSWVNFEFLRDGRALHELVDDLRADIWDRMALRNRIADVQAGTYRQRLHPLFDQISQVATVDLLLR